MNRMPILTLLTLLMIASVPAGAQDIDKGKEAAFRGDYTAALAEFRPLAEQGHAEAQFSLANLYRDGRGIARDDEQAAALYQRAAEGGFWPAALELGLLYWGQSRIEADKGRAQSGAMVRVHSWLGIAAATETVGCIAISATLRDAAAQSMTAGQIARAQERTQIWLAKYVKQDVNVAASKPAC